MRIARAILIMMANENRLKKGDFLGAYSTRGQIKVAIERSVMSGGGVRVSPYTHTERLVKAGMCEACREQMKKHYHFEAEAQVEED